MAESGCPRILEDLSNFTSCETNLVNFAFYERLASVFAKEVETLSRTSIRVSGIVLVIAMERKLLREKVH